MSEQTMKKKFSILEEIEEEAKLHELNDSERSYRYSRWAAYIRTLLSKINNKRDNNENK
jgi:hypothetical protein